MGHEVESKALNITVMHGEAKCGRVSHRLFSLSCVSAVDGMEIFTRFLFLGLEFMCVATPSLTSVLSSNSPMMVSAYVAHGAGVW